MLSRCVPIMFQVVLVTCCRALKTKKNNASFPQVIEVNWGICLWICHQANTAEAKEFRLWCSKQWNICKFVSVLWTKQTSSFICILWEGSGDSFRGRYLHAEKPVWAQEESRFWRICRKTDSLPQIIKITQLNGFHITAAIYAPSEVKLRKLHDAVVLWVEPLREWEQQQ